MATAQQIKALVASHIEGDDTRFHAVALQIAAHAARKGHGKLATELRELVDDAKVRQSAKRGPIPLARPRGELSGLLAASYPETRLSEMVLEPRIRQRLERIVREYRARGAIRGHGLSPRRKLLLMGPPGSGKTLTASALAGELRLPLFVIRLDGLITKFMGETAAKLRLTFDAMAETPGIYLFDEFDAIGGERNATNDVGEIKRVVNSFLQFIEADDSDSLVVAATNHGHALDRALFRRFDDVIEYGLPDAGLVEMTLRSKLAAFDTAALDWAVCTQEGQGSSYADITRACEDAAKDAILDGHTRIATDSLLSALRERRDAHPTE